MQKNISSFFDTRRASGIIAATVLSFVAVALITYGATTISTDINTGGALTVSGASTFNGAMTMGDAATDVILSTGQFQATSTALFGSTAIFYGNLEVDKAATATVTFRQAGINFDSNTFVIDPNANAVGIGTSTPTITGMIFGTCSIVGTGTHTASTTRGYVCTTTDVVTNFKIFAQATSTFIGGASFIVQGASSTGQNTIGVNIINWGFNPTNTLGNATLNFFGIK
jgi:hypothetical protein